MKKYLVLLIILSLSVTACGKKKIGNVKIEKIGGIIYVHNGKFPVEDIELEQDLLIGGKDAENEGDFLATPVSVKEDKNGNIYIVDSGNHNIKKYSNDGKYLKTIGEEGKAPGYFINPTDIAFFPNNDMLVSDVGNYRFQILDEDGNYLSTFKVDEQPGSIVIDSQGRIYNHSRGSGHIDFSSLMTPQENAPLINIYNRLGEKINQIGEIEDFGTPMKNHFGNALKIAIGPHNKIYASYYLKNVIKVYENNELCRVIDRKLHFKPTPMDDKSKDKSKGQNISYQFNITFDPVSYGISIDDKGNMYVITDYKSYDSDEGEKLENAIFYILEIFNPEGKIIHKIPLKEKNASGIFIGKSNKIYILDSEAMCVTRYKTVID